MKCVCYELPYWHRAVAGQTDAGEVFHVDVPLCLDCEEQTRPQDEQGGPLPAGA